MIGIFHVEYPSPSLRSKSICCCDHYPKLKITICWLQLIIIAHCFCSNGGNFPASCLLLQQPKENIFQHQRLLPGTSEYSATKLDFSECDVNFLLFVRVDLTLKSKIFALNFLNYSQLMKFSQIEETKWKVMTKIEKKYKMH